MVEVIYGHVMTREEHYVGRRVITDGKEERKTSEKMVEVIYGHVMTREEHYVGRRVMVRKRGRPQRRWLK